MRTAVNLLALPVLVACLAAVSCQPEELPDRVSILVRGYDYEWHVVYPGPDGVLGTQDDVAGKRDVHVPAGTLVEIRLESGDFIYGFRIPDLEVDHMVIPDLDLRAFFEAPSAGTHALRGDQYCGYQHEGLLGRVVVHPPEEFQQWMREKS